MMHRVERAAAPPAHGPAFAAGPCAPPSQARRPGLELVRPASRSSAASLRAPATRRRRAQPPRNPLVRFDAYYRADTALEDGGERRTFQMAVLDTLQPYFDERIAAAEAEDEARELSDGEDDEDEDGEGDSDSGSEADVSRALEAAAADLRARAAELRGAMLRMQASLFEEDVARIRDDPVLPLLQPEFLQSRQRRTLREVKEAELERRALDGGGPPPEAGGLIGARLCKGLRRVMETRGALGRGAGRGRAPAVDVPEAVEEFLRGGRGRPPAPLLLSLATGRGEEGGPLADLPRLLLAYDAGYRDELEAALRALAEAVRQVEEPVRTIRARLHSCTLALRISHPRQLIQVKVEEGRDEAAARMAVELLTGLGAQAEGPRVARALVRGGQSPDIRVGYAAVLVDEFQREPDPLSERDRARGRRLRSGAAAPGAFLRMPGDGGLPIVRPRGAGVDADDG